MKSEKILFITKLIANKVKAEPVINSCEFFDDQSELLEYSQILLRGDQKIEEGDILLALSEPSDATFGRWEYKLLKIIKQEG